MNEKIKQNIEKELPELELINNIEIKNKVVEAWMISLVESNFTSINELQGSAEINFKILKQGTQVDHLRGVANIAHVIAKEFQRIYPDILINIDTIIAGALLHDVGKPLEYNKDNINKWKSVPYIEGNPPARHSVHGYHICLKAELPISIAHIAGAHSKEGEFIERSPECVIVHYADYLYWETLKVSGFLKDDSYNSIES